MSRGFDPTGTENDPEAETRKVQLAGGSTYTVSLPKEWADEHGIDPGVEVYLRPHVDGSLLIDAGENPTADRITAEVPVDDLNDDHLARTVRSLYVAGYDAITLVADDEINEAVRRTLSDVTGAMIGAEVVEAAADRLVVRSVLDPDDISIRQSLLQLRHVALGMHEDAAAALFGNDTDPGRAVDRTDEIDRLAAMVARNFRRGLVNVSVVDHLETDRWTLFEYLKVARQLERVANRAETLGTVAAERNDPFDGRLAESAADARGVVRDATALVLEEPDVETAHRVLDRRDAVLADLDAIDCSSDDDESRLALVVDNLARTAQRGGDIAETAMGALPRWDNRQAGRDGR